MIKKTYLQCNQFKWIVSNWWYKNSKAIICDINEIQKATFWSSKFTFTGMISEPMYPQELNHWQCSSLAFSINVLDPYPTGTIAGGVSRWHRQQLHTPVCRQLQFSKPSEVAKCTKRWWGRVSVIFKIHIDQHDWLQLLLQIPSARLDGAISFIESAGSSASACAMILRWLQILFIYWWTQCQIV